MSQPPRSPNLPLDTRSSQDGAPPGHRYFTLAEDVDGVGRAGTRILMAVTPAEVGDQARELDTYLAGFSPYAFCADLLSPVVLVDKEKGKRRDFSMENMFEVVPTEVGRNGAIKEISHASATTDYQTFEHGLASYIPWGAQNEAVELYDVRAASGEMCMVKLDLSREVRVFAHATTLTNWASTNRTTLGSTAKWDNGSAKNPRADLHARITASSQPVTDIFMNPDVAFWFLGDTEVRAYLKQMMGDNALPPDVARSADTQGYMKLSIEGFPPIHICPAKRIPAAGGALTYVLGDDVILTCNPPGGLPRDGKRLMTFTTFRAKGRSGVGVTTNEYIPQGRGINGGTMFEVGYGETHFITNNTAGGLIKDVLS
jgi:hypothetical protein